MGILKKAVNEQAFLKAGIFGGPGSGKTTTGSYLAMAIAHRMGNKKPVAFFETEAGSDFLVKKFETEKIELLRVKSHSLADLIEAAKEAEASCSCLIVDSISHVWEDVCKSKLIAVNKGREKKSLYKLDKLEFQHWADVKRQWASWTDLFLNSREHIIVCGRAGGVWEFDTNDETGKKELQKVGTKMKAEGEFGYEPSLLIEMDRIPKGGDPGAGWKHCAFVLKDRTDTINGLKFEFEKPRKEYKAGDWEQTFKPFKLVFDALNLGGEHKTFDSTRTSETLFPGHEGESRYENGKKLAEIACEEILGTMQAMFPGQDGASKAHRQLILKTLFNTYSWTAVQGAPLDKLDSAVRTLRVLEPKVKSRTEPFENIEEFQGLLVSSIAPAQTPIEDDDIPAAKPKGEAEKRVAELNKVAEKSGVQFELER